MVSHKVRSERQLTLCWKVPITRIDEGRVCLEAYGNAYREYVDKTPRWIGIPKSVEK